MTDRKHEPIYERSVIPLSPVRAGRKACLLAEMRRFRDAYGGHWPQYYTYYHGAQDLKADFDRDWRIYREAFAEMGLVNRYVYQMRRRVVNICALKRPLDHP